MVLFLFLPCVFENGKRMEGTELEYHRNRNETETWRVGNRKECD